MATSAAALIADIYAELNNQSMGNGILSATIESTPGKNGTLSTKVKPKVGAMPIDQGLAKAIATAVGKAVAKAINGS